MFDVKNFQSRMRHEYPVVPPYNIILRNFPYIWVCVYMCKVVPPYNNILEIFLIYVCMCVCVCIEPYKNPQDLSKIKVWVCIMLRILRGRP